MLHDKYCIYPIVSYSWLLVVEVPSRASTSINPISETMETWWGSYHDWMNIWMHRGCLGRVRQALEGTSTTTVSTGGTTRQSTSNWGGFCVHWWQIPNTGRSGSQQGEVLCGTSCLLSEQTSASSGICFKISQGVLCGTGTQGVPRGYQSLVVYPGIDTRANTVLPLQQWPGRWRFDLWRKMHVCRWQNGDEWPIHQVVLFGCTLTVCSKGQGGTQWSSNEWKCLSPGKG